MLVLLLLACLGSVSANMRIVGGTDTDREAHPHQIALLSGWLRSFTCGGSIIADRWVLTAAHCVGSGTYYVSLNNGNRNDANKVDVRVTDVYKHPSYESGPGAFPNDVALLRTASSLTINGHSAISMASTGSTDYAGEICTITGWGRTSGSSSTSIQLKETNGNILGDGTTEVEDCGDHWGDNYNHAIHMCIHNQQTGACNGDSGGPMICGGVLAGVTSWGASGCTTTIPSVYARVSEFREWIDATMTANN